MQLQVRLEPQEIQFVIAAVNNTQIMGKDAHTVSSLLTKFEKKLEDIVVLFFSLYPPCKINKKFILPLQYTIDLIITKS